METKIYLDTSIPSAFYDTSKPIRQLMTQKWFEEVQFMETYKNSYSVQEDQVLWELHEIRHELHEELKSRPLAEFNKGARELFEQWQKPSAGRTRTSRGGKYRTQNTNLHVKVPFQP